MDIKSYLLGKQAGGGGGQPTLQEKEITITENGTTSVVADTGYDGLSEVEITASVQPNLETLTETITTNGTTTYTPSTGKDGFSSVSITTNVSGGGAEDYINGTAPEYSNNAAALIKKLPVIDMKNIKYSSFQFSGFRYLTEIEGIINTSQMLDTGYMFNGCDRLAEIPFFDTSASSNMTYMFNDCANLKEIPQFDTSIVNNMSYMCACSGLVEGQFGRSLTTVPIFNTSKVSNFQYMFAGRKALSDTSLDNILQMCINAKRYSSTKTLKQLGITDTKVYPTSRIEALPHYQDFINAGWTIGY